MTGNLRAMALITHNTFKSDVKYRQNSIMRAVGSVVFLFARIMLWRALYAGQQSVMDRTLDQLMTYTLLSVVISTLTGVNMADSVHNKVVTGSIGLDLLRPLSIKYIQIGESLGNMLSMAILIMLPTLAAGILLTGGIDAPASPLHLVLFLLSLLLSVLLIYMFESFVVSMTLW